MKYTPRVPFPSTDARITLAALRAFFREDCARRFAIRLWEGTEIPARERAPFTLVLNDPGTLRAAFAPPVDLNCGRAFTAGTLGCEGDLESAIDEFLRAAQRRSLGELVRIGLLLRRLPRAPSSSLRKARMHGRVHSIERDRAAIGFHYDQPIEFYESFLDPNLVYSCAYYDRESDTLEAAQVSKLTHTLRKLRLQPGERLLDIGCGWGGLIIHAAQAFGASALGITLSRMQYDEVRRRIAQAGVGDRARVELRDYRELGASIFDKIVSVGMFEHVGRAKLPKYFAHAYRALAPGGLFLNHGIAGLGRRGNGRAASFVGSFIFPDGELVNVSSALEIAERAGFEVRDVENLREHYVKTLRAWVCNLERNRAQAVAAAGEQSFRAWLLYMAGSAQGFRAGRLAVYQALLGKPKADGSVTVPLTRRDLYPA